MDKNVDKNGQQIEVTADGKRELVPAGEPLKKEPNKPFQDSDVYCDFHSNPRKQCGCKYRPIKKTARERWEELKKELNSNTAFMSMTDDEPQQEEQEGGLSPEEQIALQGHLEGSDEQGGDQQEDQAGDQQEDDQDQEDQGPDNEQELAAMLQEQGLSDAEIAHIIHGHMIPQADPKEAKAKNEAIQGEIESQNMQADHDIEQQLKQKEAEIDHSHKQRMADLEYENAQEQRGAGTLDKEHKKRMLDLEYERAKSTENPDKYDAEHKKRMSDLEYENAKEGGGTGKAETEHKKKMLQLEYETAKKEKELEVKYMEKEHELKLKLMEEQSKAAAKQKAEVSGIKHKQAVAEAKKPKSKKPLKKSDDAYEDLALSEDELLELSSEFEDDIEKAMKDVNVVSSGKPINGLGTGWAMHPESGDFNHGLHGNIKTVKLDDGSYQVKHNGASVGIFGDIPSVGTGIKNYVGTLGSADTRSHNIDPMKV